MVKHQDFPHVCYLVDFPFSFHDVQCFAIPQTIQWCVLAKNQLIKTESQLNETATRIIIFI